MGFGGALCCSVVLLGCWILLVLGLGGFGVWGTPVFGFCDFGGWFWVLVVVVGWFWFLVLLDWVFAYGDDLVVVLW